LSGDDMERRKYKVDFLVAEGRWHGKNLVPKDDNFVRDNIELELYEDTQVYPALISILKKKGYKYPCIRDISIR